MDKYDIISMIIDIIYFISFIYLITSKNIEDKKIPPFLLFAIGWALAIFACHYNALGYTGYCKNNSISTALVETTAEHIDMKEIDIAKFYNIASENGWELEEAIYYLDNSLSDEEINSIILESYYKEQ